MRLVALTCIIASFFLDGYGQGEPTAAPNATAFSTSPDKLGSVANSVNLFTGDVSLPMNLISLPSKEGLGINVSIAYNSNVQNTVDTWNLEAPTGILGLGWSMDIPKIIADTKQTGTREDDTYYIIEGGSSNRLVRTGSGSDGGSYYSYQTKNYQFWKIRYYYDPLETIGQSGYGTGPNKWEITRENGTKYIYGDNTSGRSTIQYTVRWNNWIGNSKQPTNQSQLATAWNLSEIINLWGERTTFEYTNIEQFVGSSSGQKQTEASYLKQITDPIGRQVQFFYNTKASQFYMEPHTEQAEPDAYQEVYEKKYLDHIDVRQEQGLKYLSTHFRYNIINEGTTTAKMLLANIEQRNSQNEAQPSIKFDYYTATDANGYKGFLRKVTYPTGGSATYTYAMQNPSDGNKPYSIGHSSRTLTINAPVSDGGGFDQWGYSEPKVWIADDYVVVAWRAKVPSGHDSNPRQVKLSVYQWVGEWKNTFLQTIQGIRLTGDGNPYMDYKDFQVVAEKNFFGVLYPTGWSGSPNEYGMLLYSKDEANRGGWKNYSKPNVNYGSGVPKLLSGEDFVAVGSFQDDATHPCHLFTYQGNATWREDLLNQTIGDHYYTSSNNFFISHNRSGFNGSPEMNFNYLTEEKNWVTKNWSWSLLFSSSNRSNWFSSNGMAVVMADSNPEYVYRWDLTYTNFFRDSKDFFNADLFGGLNDNHTPFIIDNSLIGIDGRLARFDGHFWWATVISSTKNSPFGDYFAYGSDVAVRPTEYVSGTFKYKGGRKVFDPNIPEWKSDFIMDGTDRGQDFAYVGIDYYYFGNGYYYRQPNGDWIKKYTQPSTAQRFAWGGYPRFEVWTSAYPYSLYEIRGFKNGETMTYPLSPNLTSQYFIKQPYYFPSIGVGGQTMVTYSGGNSDFSMATSLQLSRIVNDKVIGNQIDYPVRSVTTNDGSTNRITSIDYNFSTATIDPSGNYAQYNEVTVIPDGGTIEANSAGYTQTFFNNGLSNSDDNRIEVATNLHWLGQPYRTSIYDKNGAMVSTQSSTYEVRSVALNNSSGTQVEVANYVRTSVVNKMLDGISRSLVYDYDYLTGLVRNEKTYKTTDLQTPVWNPFWPAPIVIPESSIEYTYWYEKYDIAKSKNLLSPVVQVSKAANGTYTEAQVTRWKDWNAFNASGSTAPAPYDNFTWKGTNSYLFTAWDASISPATLTDWLFTGRIASRDDYTGNELETLARGNIPSATLYDIYKIRPIANISNASYGQVAYTSFEYTENYGSWSFSDGGRSSSAELGKTGDIFYQVGPIGITKSNLQPGVKYTLSFWAKANSGNLLIDGVGAVTVPYKPDWTYFEYTVTNINSLTIKLSGSSSVSIDELRLCPVNSRMSTSTYHLVYGPTSQTDTNGNTVYTQYDNWGRVESQLDENRNVIKTYTYNTKK